MRSSGASEWRSGVGKTPCGYDRAHSDRQGDRQESEAPIRARAALPGGMRAATDDNRDIERCVPLDTFVARWQSRGLSLFAHAFELGLLLLGDDLAAYLVPLREGLFRPSFWSRAANASSLLPCERYPRPACSSPCQMARRSRTKLVVDVSGGRRVPSARRHCQAAMALRRSQQTPKFVTQ